MPNEPHPIVDRMLPPGWRKRRVGAPSDTEAGTPPQELPRAVDTATPPAAVNAPPADATAEPPKPPALGVQEAVRGYLDNNLGGASTPRPPSDFQPSVVPVTGRPKARNMPSPGEEDANDATARSPIEAAGGFVEGDGSETRERFADPAGRLEKQITFEQQNPAKDKNGWWGVLKDAGVGALLGFTRGGLGGAITGGIGGAARNALDKSSDERRAQSQRVGTWQQTLADYRGRQKENLELADKGADVRLKTSQAMENTANAGYLRGRGERETAQHDRENLIKLYNDLEVFDPDATDPHTRELADWATSLDIPLLKKERGKPAPHYDYDKDGNLVSVTDGVASIIKTSDGKPFNNPAKQNVPVKVGGQVFTVPQTTGVTAAGQNLSRDESRRHNLVTESHDGERIDIARRHLSLAEAAQDASLSEKQRKDYAGAAKLLAEAEQASDDAEAQLAHATYVDPKTGETKRSRGYDEKASEFQNKAESLRQQLYSAYGYLWQKEDGHLHMTRAEWQRNHGQLPLSLASRYDIIIDDDPDINPRVPQNRTVPRAPAPRRSAPRSPSSSAPRAGEDANVRAYANQYFRGDYGAAQKAIELQRARKANQ